MKKVFLVLLALWLLCGCANGQRQMTYTWTPVMMDSEWDEMKDTRATETIAAYAPLVAPLQEIICYSADEYSKHFPESGLSNLIADVVRITAERLSGGRIDVGLTNFGGIRTSLPKGAVRVYDIYSIFPFENSIVYFDIKGSDLRAFLKRMVERGRIEALSNVRMKVDGRKLQRLEVGGAPIDDDKMYRFATSNFLMDGGDGLTLADVAVNYVNSEVRIRDAIVDYLREKMNDGETLILEDDGRVIDESREGRR